jgi:diguanylate cyclase (GGDEF)-like protein
VLRCRLVARRDLEGEPVALEGSVQDVTEGRRSEARMRSLAYTDELTQLGNRRLLEERLGFVLREAERTGTKAGVLLLDLDQFKRVNDTLGSAAGDALLREAAGRLLEALVLEEGIDCRPDEITVVRRSGGEFALLVPRVREPRALAALARLCLDALARPFVLDVHELTLGVCAGIALSPDDGANGDALVRNAAAALHHAKAQGRSGLQFYRAAMNASTLSRMLLEAKLRRALEQGEFVLHYQPQTPPRATRWASRAVRAGAWFRPRTGRVHTAGGGDRIDPAPRRVDRARGLPAVRGVGPARRLPAADLDQPVAAAVSRARSGRAHLRAAGRGGCLGSKARHRDHRRTCCCTTPSWRSTRCSRARARRADCARRLRDRLLSPRICATCPPTLAIDRSFWGIASEDSAAALTASIVAMGVALGLRVVAEGVEEEQQRRLLQAWGCHEAQGFLFGRAVPADEAESIWAARKRAGAEEPVSSGL